MNTKINSVISPNVFIVSALDHDHQDSYGIWPRLTNAVNLNHSFRSLSSSLAQNPYRLVPSGA